ncbi:hypothetical protein ABZY02_35350 [Streptomyces sp. NPDC006649]|uniref:hypothetical protein n=1 Tax=Streptomyces sp. NPDC006649 TaxID=3156896 RepID=UPI0033A0D6EB
MDAVRDTENVITALNTEWSWLCASTRNGALAQGWLEQAGVITPPDVRGCLDALLQYLQAGARSQGPAFSDRWMGALLALAAGEGSEAQLATRVVVQAMLPGAVRLTSGLARMGNPFGEVAQLVVGSLYQVVRRYPLVSRPGKIAANLIMETRHLAVRELARETQRSGDELDEWVMDTVPAPTGAEDPVTHAELALLSEAAAAAGLHQVGHPADDLVGARGEMAELLVRALAEKVLDQDGVAAITLHFREGAPRDEDAAQCAGVSHAAWRQRRSRAVGRLRTSAREWVAAA